jgi:MAPEG family
MGYKTVVHKHIVAAICILLILYEGVYLIVDPILGIESVNRLLFAAQLVGFVSLPLFVGIALTVHARYSDSSLIQGYKSSPTERLLFLQAYNTNTLEQLALSVLSLLAFCATAPEPLLVFAFAQVAAFLLGRVMFFIGYQRAPMHRLVGFAVGYYPSVVAVGAACLFTVLASL